MMRLRTIARALLPRIVSEYMTVFSGEAWPLDLYIPADKHCILEDGVPDGVVKVHSLAWLGMGFTYSRSVDVMSWEDYLAEREGAQ